MKKLCKLTALVLSLLLLLPVALAANAKEESLTDLFAAFLLANVSESEYIENAIGQQFFLDPVGFVRTLSAEAEITQLTILRHLPMDMYEGMVTGGYQKFPDAVYAIELQETDTERTHYIVRYLKEMVEEYWSVPNPEPLPDWAQYNFAEFTSSGLDTVQRWSLQNWLFKKMNWQTAALVLKGTEDADVQMLKGVFALLSRYDPNGFYRTFAQESETVQNSACDLVCAGWAPFREKHESFLRGQFSSDNWPEERKIMLTRLVRVAEANYGYNITNPKTGDPVGIVVALMAASGAGLAVMLPKKKKIA